MYSVFRHAVTGQCQLGLHTDKHAQYSGSSHSLW